MALKDWKKIKKEYTSSLGAWENTKNENQIWITGYGLNYIEKYAVLTSEDFPRKPLIKKSFKTKFAALKFVKSYMRKH